MGTIHCRCGEVFSDAEIPNPLEFHLIPDIRIEALTAAIEEAVRRGEDVETRVGYLLLSHGVTTYQCPHCGRLLVFWDGLDQPARSYNPE
jgi:hypothetical protein